MRGKTESVLTNISEVVIENESNDSMTFGVTISLYSLLKDIYSMTLRGVTERKNWISRGPELVTALDTIGRIGLFNETRWPVVEYFLENGAATALILKYRCGLVKRTAYRAIDALNALKLIEEGSLFKIPGAKKNSDTTAWVLSELNRNTRMEAVNRAVVLHQKLRSPTYRLADSIGQAILEDFEAKAFKEIHYREIMEFVKPRALGKRTLVADETAKWLHEKGFRVWK